MSYTRGLVLYTDNGPAILEDEKFINTSIEALVSRSLGSIPGYEDVGSKIKQLFWKPIDEKTVVDAVDELETLFELYETRVNLVKIKVSAFDTIENRNGLVMEIYWKPKELKNINSEPNVSRFFFPKEVE